MNTRSPDTLEVLCRTPEGSAHRTPLLFIHGAYMSAHCWEENFLPWFSERGWPAHALSLSGHGASRRRDHLDFYSLDDYTRDVAEVVASLPSAPVLIGHSMGGMVVQKYLERHDAPAVVLMASVPPQGLMGSAFGLLLKKPNLLTDLNRIMTGSEVNIDSLREALFNQPVEDEALRRYYRMSQPESHRALWDMTLFNLPQPGRMRRPPMLVLGASHDHLLPPDQVHMTARTYGQAAEIFPDMGHGMMLERDWMDVARRIAGWLEERAL